MPIHDWSRVDDGLFHHFHNAWIQSLALALNQGILPEPYFALSDQRTLGVVPDVLAMVSRDADSSPTALATVPLASPRVAPAGVSPRPIPRWVLVYDGERQPVAVIEVVSNSNKSPRHALETFARKTRDLVRAGVHVQVIDVLAPRRHDPDGIHAAIWESEPAPEGRTRVAASYEALEDGSAQFYLSHLAVGDTLPDWPLFLRTGGCVEVPLETTYAEAFESVPRRLRGPLEDAG